MRMKFGVCFGMMVFSVVGVAFGQEKEVNPFDEKVLAKEAAIAAAPETWEVMCEVFSLPFGEAVKLRRELKESGRIYAELIKRVKEKTAVLEEFAVLKGRVNQKSEMNSSEEYIYPTEYDPPELPNIISRIPDDPEVAKLLSTPSNPTSYETQDLGVTMELEGMSKEGPDTISFEFKFTLATLVGGDVWGREKAEAVMPRFEKQGMEKEVILKAGEPVLAGTMSPTKSDEGRRVWFLFATGSAGEK